jgi:hypothetical protein
MMSRTRATESVSPGDNVLLLCPVFDPADSVACVDLLTVEEPSQENILSVTITRSPQTRLAIWEQYADETPAAASIIGFEESTPSADAFVGDNSGQTEIDIDLTVSSVSDVSDLGVEIVEQIDQWLASAGDRRTVVCFHSVSALLELVGLTESFRFLSTVAQRCRSAGAIAHYHMDPRAHDEQTVERFQRVFDVVYEYDDGAWSRKALA